MNWASGFLVAFDFYPVFLFAATFGISIYCSDILLWFFGIWLSLDWWLNFALQQLFRQAPATPGCGLDYEMPSFATQHAALFVCTLWLVAVLYGHVVLPPRVLGLVFFLGIVVYARIYIGIATLAQLFAGLLVGLLSSALFMLLFALVLHPRLERVMSSRLGRYMRWEYGIVGRPPTEALN